MKALRLVGEAVVVALVLWAGWWLLKPGLDKAAEFGSAVREAGRHGAVELPTGRTK